MLSGFIQAGNLEIDLQQVMDIETASCVPAVDWNGRDCVSGQKTTPRIRRCNGHAGNQKSTLWSRHPASENGAQQRCRGLFPFSLHALEDEIETDCCKSRSPTVSSPLPKHSSSIVGAVQENSKFTSYRATNASSKDICQQVFEAAHKGDAATVPSLLLQHSLSPDLTNTDKRTLLMVACAEGHVSVVQALLRCKASVNIADSDGFTPLHMAASQGNYEVVKMLLSSTQHPDVNARANDLSSVLMRPAQRGFSIVVEYLLDNNADPNIEDHHGWTPLMKAATKGHKDVVRVLLEHGADVNITSTEGSTTALNEAVLNGHMEIVTMLVKALSESINKNRALYTCKTSEDVRKLIKNGAQVDQHQGDRSTPLMVHAEAGRVEVVRELISQGAPLDAQDQNGITALMRAAQHGHLKVVKVLVENDSILDIKCKKRKTALMYAIQGGGNKEVVKELSTAGANASIKDKNGQTAADIAEEMGYTEISALFQKRRSSQTISSTDPFLEQMSKYLSKGPAEEQEKLHLPTKSSKKSTSVTVPARPKQHVPDESGIMKKELDKAYERIAALEGRNQELTLQTTGQELIKRDDQLSCLPHEHLVEDYKKMKTMKKKADQFANEARQTAQKLSVENFRLKEELSREKHAHELHWKNVVGEVEQKLDKSKEAIKRAEERAHVVEMEYTELLRRVMRTNTPESFPLTLEHEIITPRDLHRIIFEGQKSIQIQFAVVALGGLPYSGKTELLNSMYPHDTIRHIPSDNPHRCFARHIDGLDIYELGYLKDPVSETPEWIPATGKACHFYMIGAALAKHAGTNKFPCLTSRNEQLLPFKSQHLNRHFNRVFDEVGKALLNVVEQWHPAGLLRGPKIVLMNVWDIGVHKALYEVLPLLARAFGRLILVNILDLVRDTKCLDKQPELTNEKYSPREESDIVMKARSRLHYYIRIAGLTKSAKGDQCPTTLLVATHKDKILDSCGAEKARKDLQSLAWQKAVDTGVSEVLYHPLLAVNALDKEDGQKVRHIIEEMIEKERKFDMEMPMTWMFLRSTLYDYPDVFIKWSEFDKMATECGLRTDDEKERFLTIFTHAGSLLYYPELPALKENIVLSPEHFLKDLEHLYYPQTSAAASVKAHKEAISTGILCSTVAKEIWKESSPFYLQLLQDAGLAVDISDVSLYKTTCHICSNKKTNCLFMPSLRIDGNRDQLPSPDSDSLFVTFNSEYVPTDVQALFAKYLKQELKEIELDFTPHKSNSNTTTFKFPTTSKLHGVQIYIIVHGDVIEIKCDAQCEEYIIITLCSSLKTISIQILDEVVKYFPGMEYKLAFPCPNSVARNRRTIHYLQFHPVASDIDRLFCWHCCQYINLTNDRRRWLKAAYVGSMAVSVVQSEKVTATEISNLANSLSELDYGELTDLCAAMGFFGSELNIIQGMERTDPLRPYMERIDVLRQVVTKWQSLSPENTKQRLAEIMLQNGYYVQALQLDAKLLNVTVNEPECRLSAKEMATVCSHVYNWRTLAQELGVQNTVTENIANHCRSSSECCRQVLLVSQPSRNLLMDVFKKLGYFMLPLFLETGFNEAAYN